MITRTPLLHAALMDVARHEVDFFPGLQGGHPQGFAWHQGGDVPADEQMALSTLVVVGLVDCVPAEVDHQIGAVVVLTQEGGRVLSLWESGEVSR